MSNPIPTPDSPALRTRSRVLATETRPSANDVNGTDSYGITTASNVKVNAGNGHANGNGNGNGDVREKNGKKEETKVGTEMVRLFKPTAHARVVDAKLDEHQTYEFGGPPGVTLMMLGFPLLMYYLYICLWLHNGNLIAPSFEKVVLRGGGLAEVWRWGREVGGEVWEHAKPTAFAFKTYLGLGLIELFLALVMPGVDQEGLPVPSRGYKPLLYHCNALSSWYTSLVLAFTFHVTGIFRLPWLIEYFGSLMTVSIITSFILTILIYYLAVYHNYGGAPIRMSGSLAYDIFMGASLNPRLFTGKFWALGRKRWDGVDLKMFAEVRVPWVLLFMIAVAGGVKQYEDLGYVTPNMAFMILATGLYINACAKGEQLIPQTWDMYHEKFGFLLIFWNMAGVPFTYCYPIIHMARNDPESYRFSTAGYVVLFATLLTCYYIFDTSMSQKSAFKMQQLDGYKPRKAFPQLPGAVVKDPTFIETKHGNKLLTSGWWAYARKPNYTADWIQSLTWGMSAGFGTPITFFYPAFFMAVLVHRCGRDFERCERKYGDDWKRYCEVVKYKFIPGVY